MLNVVALEGRLTKDPELRKTPQNISCLQFTLAVPKRFKKENQPEADFVTCIAWRQSAEYLSSYCRKGDLISVSGSIATRNYERNGQTVYVTEVICDNVSILAHKQAENQAQQNTNAPSADQASDIPEYDPNLSIGSDDLPFY